MWLDCKVGQQKNGQKRLFRRYWVNSYLLYGLVPSTNIGNRNRLSTTTRQHVKAVNFKTKLRRFVLSDKTTGQEKLFLIFWLYIVVTLSTKFQIIKLHDEG